jgi:O-antigen ligase
VTAILTGAAASRLEPVRPQPASDTPGGPTDDDPTRRRTGSAHTGKGRLLTATIVAYPLWWALGLGVLIFLAIAPVMGFALWRQHRRGLRVLLPPGFLIWLTFLALVVVSVAALGADPEGTVAGTAGSRLIAVVFRLGEYVALTVLLVYAGNRRGLTDARLVRLLGWLFVITVAGGLLGTFAGTFEFTSPVELLLPKHIRSMGFVQSLVHPAAAQVMELIGDPKPRPAAPWGYTNTWGNNFCLLVGWFIVAYLGRRKWLSVACLVAGTVPVVYSLNRGLWIGLGVVACYVALRLAQRGSFAALASVVVAAVVLGIALVLTPLGDVVSARLDNGKSNGVRLYLTEQALAGTKQSPLIGFGSTRTTMGGRNSIAVGESADCARCGNFTIGGNGQLWQLLFAHGLLGTAAYLGFFLYGLWRFRRDHSAIGIAGSAAIVASLVAMFWYNALVTPLAWTFCAYALLWRRTPMGKSS